MLYRSLLAAAVLAGCGNLFAELPEQWQIYCFDHENASKNGPHVPVRFRNGVVVLEDAVIKPIAVRTKDGMFDLDKITRGSANSALLVCNLQAAENRKTWLGVGCRVFAVWVNGKKVYDFTRKGLGNDYDPVTAHDHIFPVPLKKGNNEIRIETCRTSRLLDSVYGKDRRIEWKLAVRELPEYQAVKAELSHPEILSRPDIGSVMITFITRQGVPAAVDYRLRGTSEWQREWDLVGDHILREKSRVHRIRLSNLKPDSEYEYRLVLLEPPAGLDGFKRVLRAERHYREVVLPIKCFRTFGTRPDFKFFVLGDTQLFLSEGCRTVAQLTEYMRKMQALPEYQQADFVLHVGDVATYAHDLEKTYFTDFFDHFSKPDSTRPVQWVYLRGNHEPCGLGAEDWYDYFLMPGECPYYAFRRGEVLFIVLDCGDFAELQGGAYNGPMLKLDTLFERQTRWLEALRQTPEFKSAKFRVVLSHLEPQISKAMSERTRKMTANLLADQSPEGRIQLWICGHVHCYWRANRGSSDLISRQEIKQWALNTAPVNWVTVDAPKRSSAKPDFSYLAVNVTADSIQISALDENGREFDRFAIDQQGKVTELFQSPELKHFRLERK